MDRNLTVDSTRRIQTKLRKEKHTKGLEALLSGKMSVDILNSTPFK